LLIRLSREKPDVIPVPNPIYQVPNKTGGIFLPFSTSPRINGKYVLLILYIADVLINRLTVSGFSPFIIVKNLMVSAKDLLMDVTTDTLTKRFIIENAEYSLESSSRHWKAWIWRSIYQLLGIQNTAKMFKDHN